MRSGSRNDKRGCKTRERIFLASNTRGDGYCYALCTKGLNKFQIYLRKCGGGQDSVLEKNIENPDDIEFWDENGELKQNLLIKGNNLVALHSLAERLAGKVKLIYIDPPYNTGNDGFSYFDRFNHASWLTFMKNRLEAARELLRDDGVIFVQCDDNEQAYLKVLMDEIFERENFIGMFMWMKTSTPPSLSRNIRKKLEYLLCFKKNEIDKLNGGIVSGGDMPLLNTGNKIITLNFPPNTVRFNIKDGIYNIGLKDRIELVEKLEILNGVNKNNLIIKGPFKWTQETLNKELNNGTLFIIKGEKFAIRYERLGDRIKVPSNLISKTECDVGTNEDAKKELTLLFGHNIFAYPKPENLIKYIIETATNPGDIVLDYHLGSGTTAAVAHKMGRRWIGVEQMDYIDTIAKERLKKVIAGEQGGISKNVNWHGGGDFVYFELKTFNGYFLDEIEKATSKETLKKIYNDMKRSAFLKFFFDPDDFENEESENGKKYAQLTLVEQKERLKGVLDMNHIYLNEGNYDETVHTISELDKSLTAKFYGEK
ncbi:site-specific DNA-methyltransferase [Candidatus Gracilibacteria bacterium]|nr:site-specific DNA-methyltransferase [Candidatus Gracilibacteria bacterium]